MFDELAQFVRLFVLITCEEVSLLERHTRCHQHKSVDTRDKGRTYSPRGTRAVWS